MDVFQDTFDKCQLFQVVSEVVSKSQILKTCCVQSLIEVQSTIQMLKCQVVHTQLIEISLENLLKKSKQCRRHIRRRCRRLRFNLELVEYRFINSFTGEAKKRRRKCRG